MPDCTADKKSIGGGGMKVKPILHGHAGKYRGFVVLYRNTFFGFLGALRLLPRKAIVVEYSNSGKGRKMSVPVNKGIANWYPNIGLVEEHSIFFKIVKVHV